MPRAAIQLFDHLEPRCLMALSATLTDNDGDVFRVSVAGPGTFTVQTNAAGHRLGVTGTTATSDLKIERESTGPGGDGVLAVTELIVHGSIDEVRLENTNLVRDPADNTPVGLRVEGHARVIDIGRDVLELPISIDGSTATQSTSISARRIVGAPGHVVVISSSGTIASLRADTMDVAAVTAARFGDVFITGAIPSPDPAGVAFDLTSTDGTATWGLKTLRVLDNFINGNLDIAAPVQSITIKSVNSFTPPGGLTRLANVDMLVVGRLGTLRTLNGHYAGSLRAASFGIIDVNGALAASIGGASNLVIPTASIDSLRAAQITGNFVISVSGGIGQINVQSIDGSEIGADWIQTFLVTGPAEDLFLTIRGAPKRALSLGTFTVGGLLISALVEVHGNTGSVTLGGARSSTIGFGVDADFASNWPDAPSEFDATGGVVNSFRIKAAPGDAVNFVNARISARRFKSITSAGLINPLSGTDYGVRFIELPDAVNIRRLTAPPITNTLTAFADDGNFRYERLI